MHTMCHADDSPISNPKDLQDRSDPPRRTPAAGSAATCSGPSPTGPSESIDGRGQSKPSVWSEDSPGHIFQPGELAVLRSSEQSASCVLSSACARRASCAGARLRRCASSRLIPEQWNGRGGQATGAWHTAARRAGEEHPVPCTVPAAVHASMAQSLLANPRTYAPLRTANPERRAGADALRACRQAWTLGTFSLRVRLPTRSGCPGSAARACMRGAP